MVKQILFCLTIIFGHTKHKKNTKIFLRKYFTQKKRTIKVIREMLLFTLIDRNHFILVNLSRFK